MDLNVSFCIRCLGMAAITSGLVGYFLPAISASRKSSKKGAKCRTLSLQGLYHSHASPDGQTKVWPPDGTLPVWKGWEWDCPWRYMRGRGGTPELTRLARVLDARSVVAVTVTTWVFGKANTQPAGGGGRN